jgi:hypothetical protein
MPSGGESLTGKPVGAVIELQELKRIEPPAPVEAVQPIEPQPGNASND